MRRALALAIPLLSSHLAAAEGIGRVAHIAFVCTSVGGAVEVAMKADTLIAGMSPLPGGCTWITTRQGGAILEHIDAIDLPDGRIGVVARVRTEDGQNGYSAGIMPLLT